MNFSARLFVFFREGKQQENSTDIKMIVEGKKRVCLKVSGLQMQRLPFTIGPANRLRVLA